MKPANLIVSPGPHWHCGARLSSTYHNTLLALIPAAVAGALRYGLDAVGVIGAAVATAMLAELLMQKLLRRPVTIHDGSAAVSGLLLALILPAGAPLHIVVVAAALGIILGKQVFGGLGAGPLNPALVGWAIVRITQPWASYLDFDLMLLNHELGFSAAYPLAALKAEGARAAADYNLADLLLGRQTGGIGAAAVVWILVGGLYLLLRGMIRWLIPVGFLAGVVGTAAIFHAADAAQFASPWFHLLTGNVMIGAFFLATDASSAPVNRWGMIVFGLAIGALTIVFRVWSVYLDGVIFACLLMSLAVPLLDKIKRKQRTPAAIGGDRLVRVDGEEAAS